MHKVRWNLKSLFVGIFVAALAVYPVSRYRNEVKVEENTAAIDGRVFYAVGNPGTIAKRQPSVSINLPNDPRSIPRKLAKQDRFEIQESKTVSSGWRRTFWSWLRGEGRVSAVQMSIGAVDDSMLDSLSSLTHLETVLVYGRISADSGYWDCDTRLEQERKLAIQKKLTHINVLTRFPDFKMVFNECPPLG